MAIVPAMAAAAGPGLPAFDAGVALDASQAAIGRRLSDHELTDQRGRHIRLSELRGRPVVISPIYTSCFHICPTTTTHLKRAADVAFDLLGDQAFTVLTIGFDTPRDTMERMRDYARARGIDSPQWIFASADAATASRMLDETGFTVAPAGGGFEHLIQATVVDDRGVIYRQVYGQQFETPLLVDALKQIALGQGLEAAARPSLAERIRLICTTFDPKTGRYGFDYSLVLSAVLGVLIFSAIAAFIWRSWRELLERDRSR
ncbi:MAG TPA: SCO family protein [Steroidobacteraceae bacterium]